MENPTNSDKTKYKVLVVCLFIGILFLIDPFNMWPTEHLVGKGRMPCTLDDIRPTCTGKIIFPWQRP